MTQVIRIGTIMKGRIFKMVYEKVSPELNFVDRENKSRSSGKKMTFLKKVLKIVKRERHIHSMMVLQRLTVSLISVMSLQELLRI